MCTQCSGSGVVPVDAAIGTVQALVICACQLPLRPHDLTSLLAEVDDSNKKIERLRSVTLVVQSLELLVMTLLLVVAVVLL